MKNCSLKNDSMNESELQKIYNFNIYPRGPKVITDKGFVNTDNGGMGGPHWTLFIVRDKRS